MCGLKIETEGTKVLSVKGDEDDPLSRGHLCPKAPALAELHADPDRLRQPLRRTPSGDFEPIDWDTALDEAAALLHGVQKRHGNDALAVYVGNPVVHNLGALLYGPALLRQLRTRNRYSATSVDQLPHMLAASQMFGHQLLMPVPDIDRTDLMIVLGANPMVSNGSLMSAPGMPRRLRALRERGGRLVVIDPRRTQTAARADQHLFIRPGSDPLLLLAMLHVVFERGWDRLGELSSVVDGVDALREVAADFSPSRVADATGIAADEIEALTEALCTTERAVVYGRLGTSVAPFGGLSAWLLYALNAVTGHLDREGGAMFTNPAIDVINAPRGMGVGPGRYGRWRSRVRGLPEFGGELPAATLADEMLTEGQGQVRGLLTLAGNPVLSTPNGARLDRALPDLDAYVAVDFYLNETTRHASLILPPTSPLERAHYDLVFHLLAVRNTAKYSPPLFEPGPDARDDWEILHGLSTRIAALRGKQSLGQRAGDRVLGWLGPKRLVDLGLRAGPYGMRSGFSGPRLSAATLRKNPHGVDLGPLRPCLPGRLPRGRVDLAPSLYLDDVPRLRRELLEQPEVTSATTLQLIGRRQLRTNNSWMHNAPKLAAGKPRCTLLMHPEDAAERQLCDGQSVSVSSRVGEVTVPLSLSDDMMRGVVSLPHGFGHGREGTRLSVAKTQAGVSINDLTDHMRVDPLSGTAVLGGVPVQVAAAG